MFGIFKKNNSPDLEKIKNLLQDGATLIDVRSPQEYRLGHHPKAINLPLPEIDQNVEKINQLQQPILVVCRSGARSGMAQKKLNRQGIESINAGNWKNVPK